MGKMEILNVLNVLIHRREPGSVYFNNCQEFILTMLLAAKSDGLVFDMGGDDKANNRLEKSNRCVFLASPDGIRVQFSGLEPTRFFWGDEEAFWVPLPDRVVRMQRRNDYRNVLPLVNALKFKLTDDNGSIIGDWALHDLCVSGFGANVDGEPHVRIGDSIAHTIIWISDKKRLDCRSVVRHITQLDRHGRGRYRVGVDFMNLSQGKEVAIKPYINKIENERHKLLAK